MNRIRFCHVIDGSNHNPLLYNSIKFSDREKFEYTIISLEPANGLQEQMKELGVHSFSLNYTSRKQAISALWRLYKYFRNEKIQIVQSHLFDASLIGLCGARLADVPVTIFTGHHSAETPLHNRKLLTFVDGLSGRFFSRHTIAPSSQMKEIFVRDLKLPASKIAVVHHGFDLEKWRAEAKKGGSIKTELGIENKKVFGAVGRLFWVKGFEALVAAFTNVAMDRDDLVLLIVGEGTQRNRLEARIRESGMEGKIILTGRRTDIASVIAAFDVFVHSSIAESFGMVFIEAFALGIPIVSTPVGVVPEIIKNGTNGFLSDGVDVNAITDALNKMLAVENKWREMGENGRAVSEEFDVRKTQAECDALYIKWLNQA
jgi:glycosyltransferase involved in cell wall biosynthesis